MSVELEDLITIRTPEGVELKLQLAGLGSRFIAGATDLITQVALTLILAVLTGGFTGLGGFLEAVFVIGVFAIWVLYPIFFEVLAKGRTPGKRSAHLRVVRDDGSPVDLPASAIRNLMRLLDGPVTLYLPTVIAIAVSPRNQRPGDFAAGTLVIRDRLPQAPTTPASLGGGRLAEPASLGGGTLAEPAAGWDVSAISAEELTVIRRFLERRHGLDGRARDQLAARLSQGLRPKVAGAPADLEPEAFLEQLAETKANRR